MAQALERPSIKITKRSKRLRHFLFAAFLLLPQSFTQAVAADDFQIAISHARAMRNEEKTEEALRLYNNLAARYPKSVSVYVERADVLKELGFMDKAIADVNSALALNASNMQALRVRGHLYDMTGKLDLAIRDYNVLIAHDKTDAGRWRARGIAYKRLKRYAEAARDLGEAARAEPQGKYYAEILYDQADMLLLSGDYNQSVKVFTQLAKVAPEVSTAYWGRARAYDKLRKSELAARDRALAKKFDMTLEHF